MRERSFLDSNILVYCDDAANTDKKNKALDILQTHWHSGNLVISTQVLQEYFVVATRKLKVPTETARRKIFLLRQLDIISITHDSILNAIDAQQLYQLSFWDALIVQMAQQSHCTILYSEDMQHNRQMGSLRVINPFLE